MQLPPLISFKFCMCVYVCVHVWVHGQVQMDMCKHAYMCTRVHTCRNLGVPEGICTCMCLCSCVLTLCAGGHVYVYVCMCSCVWTGICADGYMCVYTCACLYVCVYQWLTLDVFFSYCPPY